MSELASNTDQRIAPLPAGLYDRPPAIDPCGLKVTVYGEDGSIFGTFDFGDVEAPNKFLKELICGFAAATGSTGRWRSKSTVKAAASALRSFATAISTESEKITCASDLTPEIWWAWRGKLEARVRWPGQINLTRALLYELPTLRDTTRRALSQRAKKPKNRTYSAYSEKEFRKIKAAAWSIVRKARQRIADSIEYLRLYNGGLELQESEALPIRREMWTRGMLLDYISKTGRFPAKAVPHYHINEFRKMMAVDGEGDICQALFATNVEIFSIMILFVCELGYNNSVLALMKADTHRADSREGTDRVHVLPLEKARRGPKARYFTHSLSGRSALLMDIAIDITQPARDTLDFLGKFTDQLFIGRAVGCASAKGMPFRLDWSAAATTSDTWHRHIKIDGDNGLPLRVTLKRLRLTEQVINQRTSQNSDEVSETIYRKADPHTHNISIDRILRGQMDALSDAESVVGIRSLSKAQLLEAKHDPSSLAKTYGISVARLKQLLSGQLDTVVSACADFDHGPYSKPGDPCLASFLQCLSCRNAIATPSHLPKLVALRDALLQISSTVETQVWQADYLSHYSALASMLSTHATREEIDQAKTEISQADMEMLDLLLTRRLDA